MGKGMMRLPRAPEELDAGDVVLARTLRRGPLTRADLAEVTGWSRNTVASRLDRLIAEGWVVETGDAREGDRGRPSQRYALNPLAGLIFVAQFDVARIEGVIVSLDGSIIARESCAVEETLQADGAVAVLTGILGRLTERPGIARDAIRMAVIGVRGPVAAQTVMVPWSMPGVMPEDLSRQLGMRVVIENDANLMALGAYRHVGQVDSLLFILVETGIGAGLIVGGQLHHGLQGWSGEIGHIPVAAAVGRPCPCGNTGCLAMIASNPALLRAISSVERPVETVDDLERYVMAGDVEAIGALRQAGRHIGEAIVGLIVGLAPEIVAVGGRIGLSGGHVLAGIREGLSRGVPPALSSRLVIEAAPIASLAIGALDLALETLFAADSTGRNGY